MPKHVLTEGAWEVVVRDAMLPGTRVVFGPGGHPTMPDRQTWRWEVTWTGDGRPRSVDRGSSSHLGTATARVAQAIDTEMENRRHRGEATATEAAAAARLKERLRALR